MLYRIIKILLQVALRLYFRRIHRTGLSAIDNGKPALIIANHSASFLDAWLIGTFVKRKIYFFTRGDVFEHPVANKLLRSVCLLPVYRLSEGRDNLQRNDVSNDEAIEIFSEGGAVTIFAEGISDTAKVLRPLKKGPFRLAARSVEEGWDPTIIAAGVNYITPTRPFGDVYINVSPGIPARDFFDPENPLAVKAATEMMRSTQTALEPLAWKAGNADIALDADEVLLFAQEHFDNLSFTQTEQIVLALNNEQALQNAARAYRQARERAGASESVFASPLNIGEWIGLITLFPFTMPGYLFNFPPIHTAKVATEKKVKAPDFYSPVLIGLAIVFTPLWYMVIGLIGLIFIKWYVMLLILTGLAVSGILYIKIYRNWVNKLVAGVTRKKLSKRKPDEWKSLQLLHLHLLQTIKRIAGATK